MSDRSPGRGARARWWVLGVLLAAAPAPVSAQASPWDYGGLEMTRPALEQLLAQYVAVVASQVYGAQIRTEARTSADQIEERLEQGDFRVGDRIVVNIAGEQQLTETVTVQPGVEISLPGMGRISLAGILRSELQGHLEREIGRFVRNPIIRTASLVRLVIEGAVLRPGFYVVPATALLDDVIMQAGGPGANADLQQVRIQRNGATLVSGQDVRSAFTEGRSVDQLNLRAGDQIVVPPRATSTLWRTVGRYALMIGLPLLFGVRMF